MLSLLVAILTSCESWRFSQNRFYDEKDECWYDAKDDKCIPYNDPSIFDDYVLVPVREVEDLYINYKCMLNSEIEKAKKK